MPEWDDEYERLLRLFKKAEPGKVIILSPDKEPDEVSFPERPTRSDNLTRVEAMEWAADYVERHKLFSSPTNSRGYTPDGYIPPTPDQKMKTIIQLAEWVAGG